MNQEAETKLFQVLSPEEEKEYRKWARDNWKHGTDINPLWHPVVRAECAQVQAEYPAILAVARDKARVKGVTDAIINAVSKAWYDQAAEILDGLQHDTLNGCWYINRWGMYVGMEYDGYIHT